MKNTSNQMLRPTKKLELQRETLRWLRDDSLRQIHGGDPSRTRISHDPCRDPY